MSLFDSVESEATRPSVRGGSRAIILFLICLPLLSVVGAQFVRSWNNEVGLLVLILLLGLIPMLAAFNKIPERLFPLAIATTALALLFATSLNSAYLWGSDIHQEYYFANLVRASSFWDSTIPSDYNGMLSIVILAPICSIVSGIPLIWVFKIIYPLLFSLVPVVLYRAFKTQVDSKTAFLSVFFFVSVFTFYTEMLALARQQIGEIFLALLILLVVDKSVIGDRTKMGLLLVFAMSLALSHYALAYIFVLSATFVLLVSYVKKTGLQMNVSRTRVLESRILQASDDAWPDYGDSTWIEKKTIRVLVVAFLWVFTVSWYVFVSRSVIFGTFLDLVRRVVFDMPFELLKGNQGASMLLTRRAVLQEINAMLQIAMQGLIVVGFVGVALGRIGRKLKDEYFSFCLFSFTLLLLAVTVPYVASSLNATRLYHISLLFLAPFAAFGALAPFELISRMLRFSPRVRSLFSKQTGLKAFSVFLFVFLLFNTGFVQDVAGTGSSIANPYWALNYGNARDRYVLYNSYTPVEEIASAMWFSQYRNESLQVYSDYRSRNNALNAYAMIARKEGIVVTSSTEKIEAGSYVYLRRLNIFDGLMEMPRTATGAVEPQNSTIIVDALLRKADLIYSDEGSNIYYTSASVSLSSNG